MTDTNLDDIATTKIYSNRWVATVLITEQPDNGIFHIYATTIGESSADALAGAEHVMNAFAFGRVAYLRNKPEVNSDTDFDTKLTTHKGFVRFSYQLKAGDWQHVVPAEMVGLGSLT